MATTRLTKNTQERIPTLGSISRPLTPTTGTGSLSEPMELDEANEIQTIKSIIMANNSKRTGTKDFATIKAELTTIYNQMSSESKLQPSFSGIRSKANVGQRTKNLQHARVYVAANSKSISRSGCLFLKLLNIDIRYLIYNNLVDSEHEVIISPNRKHRGPISALSTACLQIRDEIKE